MGEALRHNAPDGRCRYTLGAQRCPAVGSVRVGDWWVCESHRYWAERPGDPERIEDGQAALEVEMHRARLRGGSASADEVAASTVAKEELAKMRSALCGEVPRTRNPWTWARELAVTAYRDRRQALERSGVGRQEAHEQALRETGETIARRVGG
jgi:hypothetical protein